MLDIIILNVIMYLHRIIDYTLMTEKVPVKILPYYAENIWYCVLKFVFLLDDTKSSVSSAPSLRFPPCLPPYHTLFLVGILTFIIAFMVCFMRGCMVGHLCSGCFKWILSQDFEIGHFKIVHFWFPGTKYHP